MSSGTKPFFQLRVLFFAAYASSADNDDVVIFRCALDVPDARRLRNVVRDDADYVARNGRSREARYRGISRK